MHLGDLAPNRASGLPCVGLVGEGDQSAGWREGGAAMDKQKGAASTGACCQWV